MRFIDEDGVIVTVYQPNERQGGLGWAIKQAWDDITVSRHVIARLFWRDYIAQFRQKLLGYLWALLGPFMGILSFLFLQFTGVLQPGQGDIPYTLYVLLGSNIWACLPGSIGAVGSGLQAHADLIMRTRIPKLALAVSSLSMLAYNILISMITTGVVFLLHGMTPSGWFLLYPLLVLPLILLGTAIGLVLAVVGTIARDLTPLVNQALALIMFITPIIYVRSTIQNPFIQDLIHYNPLTYLIEIPRALIATGSTADLNIYLWVAIGILIFVVICLRVFYLLEDLVAERL